LDTVTMAVPVLAPTRPLEHQADFTDIDPDSGEIVSSGRSAYGWLACGWRVRLASRRGQPTVVVEGSLPKALYGQNVEPLPAALLPEALAVVGDDLAECLGADIDLSCANVSRVDFVRDFQVERPERVLRALDHLVGGATRTYRPRNGQVQTHVVEALSVGWRVSAYNKEFESNRYGIGDLRRQLADARLRVEIGLRPKQLGAHGILRVSDINDDVVDRVLRSWVHRSGVDRPIGGRPWLAARLDSARRSHGAMVDKAIGSALMKDITGSASASRNTRAAYEAILKRYGLTIDQLRRIDTGGPSGHLDYDRGTLVADAE
jgi:hypothetical protein